MLSPALGMTSKATRSIWQTTNAQSVRLNACRHVHTSTSGRKEHRYYVTAEGAGANTS